jgi:putative transposase
MIQASLNYVTRKDRKQVVMDLKPVYKAATADEAERELREFESKWPKYPAITRLWRDNWNRVIPFFAFPLEMRKIVYTTNAVESLHMSLRKIIKPHVSFPSEEAAIKLLYLALMKVVANLETEQHWKQMLKYLDTVCADRTQEARATK